MPEEGRCIHGTLRAAWPGILERFFSKACLDSVSSTVKSARSEIPNVLFGVCASSNKTLKEEIRTVGISECAHCRI